MTEAIEVKNKNTSTPSEQMPWEVGCWICGSPVSIKFSKKNKLFLICNNCGVQTFVRDGKAEELLIDKVQQYRNQQRENK